MTIKDIDTSKLLFDIKSPTFVDDIKERIIEFKEYKGSVPEKKVFSHIVLMYDPNSSLWKSERDFYDRKRVCAELVDFPKKKNKWNDDVESMLVGTNDEYNSMMAALIAQFGIPELYQLIVCLYLLNSEMKKVIAGNGNKDSYKITMDTGDKITELTRIILHSGDKDEISTARNALYAKAEKERQKVRPEDFVTEISEKGTLPGNHNPFGEGYVMEKSKFLGDEEPR